jgi:ABC-type polysaccharide/polyol phosphate export permease
MSFQCNGICYHRRLRKSLPGRHFVTNLIERRGLLAGLVKRDFETRYIGSVAGWLWGVIHPLVLLLVYTLVFSVILGQTPGAGEVTQNYPLYLFAGMLPWLLFNETVSRSTTALLEQATLITKTVFPSEVVPVAIFLSSLVSHLIAVGLAIAGAGIFLQKISPALVALPLMILLLGLFAIGLGWVTASLQVYLRDTAQVLTVALTLWFWATPIFISERRIRGNLRLLFEFNPLAPMVHAYRDVLLGGTWPRAHDLGLAAVWGITVFVAGGLFFRYMKRGFADVL